MAPVTPEDDLMRAVWKWWEWYKNNPDAASEEEKALARAILRYEQALYST